MRSVLLVTFGAFSLLACDACASDYCNSFIENLRHSKDAADPDTEHWIVSCKDHPTIAHAAILAIASPQEHIANPLEENYDLELSLVDTRSQMTLAQGTFKAKLPNGGGPRLSGILLDTGRYFVSPGLRAFGVRAELGMNFTNSQELNLFVIRGKHILGVLFGATTHVYFTNRWSSCHEQTREAKRTLIIDKALSNGFNDIDIKEQLTDMEQQENSSGECKLVSKKSEIKKYRLKFDGKEYIIPNEMMHFDCRVC